MCRTTDHVRAVAKSRLPALGSAARKGSDIVRASCTATTDARGPAGRVPGVTRRRSATTLRRDDFGIKVASISFLKEGSSGSVFGGHGRALPVQKTPAVS